MRKPEVALCNWHDDWQGLYINGVRVMSEHSIQPEDLLDQLAKLGAVTVVELPTWEDDESPWKGCEDQELWDGPPETIEAFWEGPQE